MPILKNPKHEQFAHDIAQGKSNKDAALAAGYSAKSAGVHGSRLSAIPEVRQRIVELRTAMTERAKTTTAITKAWVMEKLVETAALAVADQQYGVARSCYVDLGKEIGMFVDRRDVVHWNGDLATLDDGQLENLTYSFEVVAYGEERARLEAAKRKALSATASEASREVVEQDPQEPEPLEIEDPEQPRTWQDILESIAGLDRETARARMSGLLPVGWKAPSEFGSMATAERAAWLDANYPLPVE